MIAAFSRLFSILFMSIIALGLALIALRYVGSNQTYSAMEHPLLTPEFVWVGATDEQPRWEHWRLRLNADRRWQLEVNGEMRELPTPTTNTGIWLDVIDPTSADKLGDLSEFVKNFKLEKAVVFASAYQNIGREMRKIEPMWLYGSSVAESARVRFFTSLFLEPIANIDSDILVVEKLNSSRLTEELRKRHKKLFIKLRPGNEADLAMAQELKSAQMIDGAIIAP